MLIFGSPTRVDTETTFGAFVHDQLFPRGIQGMALDDASFAALLDEIWSADPNQYLRASSPDGDRQHSPAGDSKTATWRLYPDEWVYLPEVEFESPGWRMRRVTVSTSDVDTACTDISQWCTEQGLILPSAGDTATDATPSISPDALQSYVYNSLLRQGMQSEFVYFYAASPSASNIDVPPSTPAGGAVSVTGRATPTWLPKLWHYIDRIRALADFNAKLAQDAHQLSVDGRFVVASLRLMKQVMAIYARDKAPAPPPTGVIDQMFTDIGNAFSPDHGMPLDIHELNDALPDLIAKAQTELVDSPQWSEIAHLKQGLAQLGALVSEDAFTALYEEFDTERGGYPKTQQALQVAISNYAYACMYDPSGDPTVQGLLDAFLDGQPGSSPVTREIALVFGGKLSTSQATDDASAVANLTQLVVGNTPGPAALWVALTRLGLVVEIGSFGPQGRNQTWRKYSSAYSRYMAKLGQAAGISADLLKQFEQDARASNRSQPPSKVAKAFAQASIAAETVAGKTQVGPKLTAAMGLLNLWGIVAGLRSYKADANSQDDNRDMNMQADMVSVAQAGTGLAGDVVQVIGKTEVDKFATRAAQLIVRGANANLSIQVYDGLTKILGFAGAAFCGASGIYQVAQGISDQDWDSGKWKVASGASSILMSLGFWVDVLVTNRAKAFALQLAAEDVILGLGSTELLLGLGSAFNIAGILVGIIVIAATHQDAVMKIAYALFAPGPRKWVDTLLQQIGVTRVVAQASGGLKGAVANLQAAADRGFFVTWVIRDSTLRELQALGLNDDDVGLLRSIPVQVGVPVGP